MNNRVVVVTGSSTGIGRSIALRFADSGASVILHGRGESEQLLQTRDQIRGAGGKCEIVCCDFGEPAFPESLTAFVDDCWAAFRNVNVWVNNAGGDVLTGPAVKMSADEKLDYLWRVDVRATLKLSQLVGAKMFEQSSSDEPADRVRPVIMNVGWDQAWKGMAGESGEIFATTKGAVMSMTMSLAKSFAPRVRVNCIAPGWIKTDWGDQASDKWSKRAVRESLMERWGTPEDIAGVALFLAGADASFISGQIINVNGGFNSEPESE